MPFWRRLLKGVALTWAELDSNFNYLDQPSPVVLTISGGIVTIPGPGVFQLETEGAAPSDELTGITGGEGRKWPVLFFLNNGTRTITVVHTPPTLMLVGGVNFLLNTLDDNIEFRDRTSTIWVETNRNGIP